MPNANNSAARERRLPMLLRLWLLASLGGVTFACGQSNGDRGMTQHFGPQAFSEPAARGLAEAVAAGNVKAALAAAAQSREGVNVHGSANETPLLLAVERLDLAMVDALLKAGADPSGAGDRAPIALAVQARDLAIARRLLDAGADPNGRLGEEPALFRAALIGALPALDLLLSAHARIDEPSAGGESATLAAASADRWLTVEQLLARGASTWTTDQAGFTLGAYAAHSRLRPDSEQGQARERTIVLLRQQGFPWPPPKPAEVRALRAKASWPPVRPRPASAP